MKTRSRFLKVPVEPFAVEPELRADELLEKMERISFQGRSLGVAHRVWQKMLADTVALPILATALARSAAGVAAARRRPHIDPGHCEMLVDGLPISRDRFEETA